MLRFKKKKNVSKFNISKAEISTLEGLRNMNNITVLRVDVVNAYVIMENDEFEKS